MLTLAALCDTAGENMTACGQSELARVWDDIEKIRAKQAAKPVGSALPMEWTRPVDPDIELLRDMTQRFADIIEFALPKFDWSKSPLDARAIEALNRTPHPGPLRALIEQSGSSTTKV